MRLRPVMMCALAAIASLWTGALRADDFAPNSYEEVNAHLETGGDVHIYLSTDSYMDAIDSKLEAYRELAVLMVKEEEGARDAAAFDALFGMCTAFFRDGGLRDVRGFGMSSVQTTATNYRTKSFIHAPKVAGPQTLLNLYGEKAHPLTALNLLPRDTVIAASTDFDADTLWRWMNTLIVDTDNRDMIRARDELFNELMKNGVDPDAVLGSTAGEFTFVITMNPKRRVQIPLGQGNPLEIPEPAAALVVKVKDDTIFKLIDGKLAEFEVPHTKVADDNIAMRLVQVGGNAPFKLLPVIAQMDGYFVIATSDDLVLDIANTLRGRVPGIAKSDEFALWSKDLPAEGNGFILMTPAFTQAIVDVKAAAVANAKEQAPEIEQFMPLIDLLVPDEVTYTYQVTARTPDGILSAANSSKGGIDGLMRQFMLPAGIVAVSAMVPEIIKARRRARRVDSAGNMKQLGLALLMYSGDHGGDFPKADGVAGLNELVKEDILSIGKVWVSPLDEGRALPQKTLTEATTSYAYIGGGFRDDNDHATSIPIAIEKPTNGEWVNMLFIDGHVEGIRYYGDTLEGVIREMKETRHWIKWDDATYQLLLEKARARDKAEAAK